MWGRVGGFWGVSREGRMERGQGETPLAPSRGRSREEGAARRAEPG